MYEDCDKTFFRKYHLLRHQRQKHLQGFVQDSHSSTEHAVHGLSDNISTSLVPVNPPVQPEYSFPAESLGCSANSETAVQFHAEPEDAEYEEKREMQSSSFGDDTLALSADNDEWPESSPQESKEPAAGCSQWADYGEELKQDITVSIFTDRHLLWPPYGIGQAIIFALWFLLSSSPIFLSFFFRRRLDVYHST